MSETHNMKRSDHLTLLERRGKQCRRLATVDSWCSITTNIWYVCESVLIQSYSAARQVPLLSIFHHNRHAKPIQNYNENHKQQWRQARQPRLGSHDDLQILQCMLKRIIFIQIISCCYQPKHNKQSNNNNTNNCIIINSSDAIVLQLICVDKVIQNKKLLIINLTQSFTLF